MLFEVITDLVLPFRAHPFEQEVVDGQAAPQIADDKEQDESVKEAVGKANPGDIGKEKQQRQRRYQREAREAHGAAP
jgi:hypothetical protein